MSHTRASTEAGPDFCAECSEAIREWVKWPCPTVTKGDERKPTEPAVLPQNAPSVGDQ